MILYQNVWEGHQELLQLFLLITTVAFNRKRGTKTPCKKLRSTAATPEEC